VPCATSNCYPIELLPHPTTTSLPCPIALACRLITSPCALFHYTTSSLPCALPHHVTSLLRLVASSHYLICPVLLLPTSSCCHHSLLHWFTSLPHCLKVPFNPPPSPFVVLSPCCFAPCYLVASLPCVDWYFSSPSCFIRRSLEELGAWKRKFYSNHQRS